MNDKIDSLLGQIRLLEKELASAVQRKEVEFLYEIRKRKISFSDEAKSQHKRFVKRIHRYVLDSRFLVIATAPLIWSCLLPFLVLDLVVSVYQMVCFPIYGIPKVRRGDYVFMDRRHLGYLNGIEKLNCVYCGYANGLLARVAEIAARTEQYWCPIKHALRMKSIHSRYKNFLDYGDAEGYRQRIEEVRRSFRDIEGDVEGERDIETADKGAPEK